MSTSRSATHLTPNPILWRSSTPSTRWRRATSSTSSTSTGPVARVHALTRGRALYEPAPHTFTRREMFALGEYAETSHMRGASCQLVDQAVDVNSHVATRVVGRPPQTQRESFDLAARAGFVPSDLATRLGPSTGLRNLLVHDHADVDLDRIAASIPHVVEKYGDYVREVGRALSRTLGDE